ncbi:MAG: hypothetical protein KBC84_10960 [Proteobacteria bacterium]|nr:hypothetical protein [Pseudomonadota bacterium]
MNRLFIVSLLFISACSMSHRVDKATTVVIRPDMSELQKDPVPGTVNDVWVEEMHDTVHVPGKIDPKGMYYRQGHTAVVQVRQGRFQKVEYPDDQVGVK